MLRRILISFTILGFIGRVFAAEHKKSEILVYLGTMGESIAAARLDQVTGQLTYIGPVAEIKRPTWLALDPTRPVLYAVSEVGNEGDEKGSVYSFTIDSRSGELWQIGKADSGGFGPTYLSFDSRAQTLFVGNFGGGQVAAVPVLSDGSVAPPASIQTDVGHGPKPGQRIPHAHCTQLDPSGRFVISADMGADRIFIYRYDSRTRKLAPSDPPFVETGPATGPRHFVFSQNGRFLYAITELTAEVRVFRWDEKAGLLRPIQSLSIDSPEFTGTRSGSEIGISADGRFVYTSNRATNSIQVFAASRHDGTLEKVQDIATGGEWPRSFGIDPSGLWMIVANRISKNLTVFAIDISTGKLSRVGAPVPIADSPAALAFYSR